MDKLLFTKYQLATPSKETEYGQLLKQFLEPINASRLKGKYKPYTLPRLSAKIAYLVKDKDYSALYYLLSVCKDSGKRAKDYNEGFSKRFFFEIKAK